MNSDDARFDSRAPKAGYPRAGRGNSATPPVTARKHARAAASAGVAVALLAPVVAAAAITTPLPALDPAALPLPPHAAEGDDGLMSQAPEATPR